MNANPQESAFPTLDGLEMPATITGKTGFVEEAMTRQIAALERTGNLDDRQAGLAALALVAARQVDDMGAHGRPSGRALMLQAACKVFELLPEIENANTDDFKRLLDELKANDPEPANSPGQPT